MVVMTRLLIEAMHGLGDNIYHRPYIRALCSEYNEVWLATPWPELFADLPVRFAKAGSALRTQALNEARQTVPMRSANRIPADRTIRAMDGFPPLPEGAPYVFDLPNMGPNPIRSDKPIAVVRPVTVRKEWANPSRNPKPEYVAWVAEQLMETHTVVLLASLEPGQEWALDPLPPCHVNASYGQLAIKPMLALVRSADVIVGGVGWIVPAAIALKTRAFIVLGGRGACEAPEVLTDPRMDVGRIGWAMPDQFCRCGQMDHDCNKTISDLPTRWANFWKPASTSPASCSG